MFCGETVAKEWTDFGGVPDRLDEQDLNAFTFQRIIEKNDEFVIIEGVRVATKNTTETRQIKMTRAQFDELEKMSNDNGEPLDDESIGDEWKGKK